MKFAALFFLVVLPISTVTGQELTTFSFSDCKKECIGDSTKIDLFQENNGLLTIELTAYANCAGNMEGNFKLKKDTLNLIYYPKRMRVIDEKTGEVEELINVAMCECVFKLTYEFRGLRNIDRTKIKVNGKTLTEINKQHRGLETIETITPIDSVWASENAFLVVDHSAEFPGGIQKLEEHIRGNLIYPKESEKRHQGGQVFVEFTIQKNGVIDDSTITVLRGLDKAFNEEAVRLIKECPNWTPGYIQGKPVKQKYVYRIVFEPSTALKN